MRCACIISCLKSTPTHLSRRAQPYTLSFEGCERGTMKDCWTTSDSERRSETITVDFSASDDHACGMCMILLPSYGRPLMLLIWGLLTLYCCSSALWSCPGKLFTWLTAHYKMLTAAGCSAIAVRDAAMAGSACTGTQLQWQTDINEVCPTVSAVTACALQTACLFNNAKISEDQQQGTGMHEATG